jgi:hypothetical protein
MPRRKDITVWELVSTTDKLMCLLSYAPSDALLAGVLYGTRSHVGSVIGVNINNIRRQLTKTQDHKE